MNIYERAQLYYGIGAAIYVGIRLSKPIGKAIIRHKIKKELVKELNHIKREKEKGIIDVENYVIYPA